MFLRNACLRFLRDGGYRLPSQALPVGCSESVLPLIKKFFWAPVERITDRKGDGEFQGQDAADMPLGNSESDTNGEAGQADGGICAIRKGKALQTFQKAHNHRNKLPDKALQPTLLQIVLRTPGNVLGTVLDKWIEDGNCLVRDDLLQVYSHLKRHRLPRKTFQFLEWIKTGELLNFKECDYAFHLQLLARYSGIEAVQKYIERVPKCFRNQVFYETLLANYVRFADVQKAEEAFQEIIRLSLPLTVSACNQMLLLYKRFAHTKVASILELMEKENINPSSFTFKILIDLQLRLNDTSGMDAVLDIMKANGFESDVVSQTMIAKFYISRGLTEKAEEVIKAMEVYVNGKPRAIRSLLDLYATLGRPDDVARIWKLCTEPKLRDYVAATGAWGKLGHIEEAEQAFATLVKTYPKLTSKYLYAMLNVYAENKLQSKGEELLEKMFSARCPSDPLTWEAIVNLYVNSGEVQKADSFLLKVVAQKKPDRNPLLWLHTKLLKVYAEKGDVYNAEKIFDRLKKMRYPGRILPYDSLLEAYVNAKFPAYGVLERMRADNVLPSKTVMKQLNCLENLQEGGKTERVE